MPNESRHPAGLASDPASNGVAVSPGYEVRDTNVRSIVLFGVGLAVIIVVSMAGLWVLLKAISGDQPEPPSPLKSPDVIHSQRAALRAEEKAALEGGYGWTDKAAGTVKLPIEDAMKLVAERGIPAASTKPRTEADVNSHAGKILPRDETKDAGKDTNTSKSKNPQKDAPRKGKT